MREIVLDLETTGIDPAKGEKIIEIGCIELYNKIITGIEFHAYVNPKKEITAESYRIHGISNKNLIDKPIFAKISNSLLEFIKNDSLVIHNAGFDIKFLNHELQNCSMHKLTNEIIDTLSISRKKFPGSPVSLDALCKRFNINSTARIKHGALLDAKLLAQVYIELCGGLQTSLLTNFNKKKQNSTPKQVNKNIDGYQKNTKKKCYRRVSIQPNIDEASAHEKYIKTISNTMWKATN
ncbi:DNA polymerase III subunit epsilon [Candidatus Xenohaliotis californiensis]|uniref:DNA polymerase III subunit epsilon n=1 Tax=Candidatus Xenohaliotis californiensis TaxID=84677 RepID=A0ABM9N727_9RICK|nr:DNA polymerase III subunit epsilon [Candidatus Xenohaliotis californiensis]